MDMVTILMQATALMLALILLRPLLKRYLSARWCCALWALPALRLLLPFEWESSLSVMAPMQPVAQEVENAVSRPVAQIAPSGWLGTGAGAPVTGNAAQNAMQNAAQSTAPIQSAAAPEISLGSILLALWLVGAAIIGGIILYQNIRFYASVKRLNDVSSEGIALEEVTNQFPETLQLGDTGIGVSSLQYYLAYISQFYNTITPTSIDGIFGEGTRSSVISAQNTFGLTPDGVVGEATWNAIYDAYLGIVNTIPIKYVEGNAIPFPGVFLRVGIESEDVRVLQEYLRYISQYYSEIPSINPTGYFGYQTENAVRAAQSLFGLEPNGIVGPVTWLEIARIYSDLFNGTRLNEGQYPGFAPQ